MKKFFLMLAVAASAMSASAQEPKSGFADAKFWDNWYLGANLGVMSKATDQAVLKNLNPEFGIRFGKWFTPSVGLSAEGAFLFGNKTRGQQFTDPSLFHAAKVHLLGTINFSNAFGGYTGSPRPFEVIGLAGIGFIHNFGTKPENWTSIDLNMLSSKFGLDFAWNFGSEKEWQFYVEPALNYALNKWYDGENLGGDMKYDINQSIFELKAGVNYKFGCSNGTHNFAIEKLRDQAEIDALNAQINELRNRKPQVIEKEKIVEKIVEKEGGVREVKVENLVFVTFAQGKSALTADAKKALDEIKEGKHVQIVGTASPEGSKELNDKLSQARADVVADYLRARGIVVDEATGKGVQGTTSNRLAVVYVK